MAQRGQVTYLSTEILPVNHITLIAGVGQGLKLILLSTWDQNLGP